MCRAAARGVLDTVDSFGVQLAQVSAEALAGVLAGASVVMTLVLMLPDALGTEVAVRLARQFVPPGSLPGLGRGAIIAPPSCAGVGPSPGPSGDRAPRAPP